MTPLACMCEPGNDALYRLDGGPLTCADRRADLIVDSSSMRPLSLVRVFHVDGEAPDILIDMDWRRQNRHSRRRAMGLKPSHPRVKTRFRQYHEIECGFLYDFDGDGNAGGCVAGARPGGITRPPR